MSRIQRRLAKAVALYEKHNPGSDKTFYDLPVEARREYHRRANRVYSYSRDRDEQRRAEKRTA